jgi:hypothetical protein
MMNTFGRRNRLGNIRLRTDIGFQTIQFLQFFCEHPDRVLSGISDDSIEQQRYRCALADVTFLHQELLNRELYEFLVDMGYPRQDVTFVLDAERVNATPGKSDRPNLGLYYSVDLARQLMDQERLLFDLFPEYCAQVQDLLQG